MPRTTPHRNPSHVPAATAPDLGGDACRFSVGSVAGWHAGVNQDSYACRAPDFFAVADGVGGGCLGEVASAMLVRQLGTLQAPTPEQVAQSLATADAAIAQRIAQEGGGPGAAVCAAVWCLDDAACTWLAMTVGDCQVMVQARPASGGHIRWSSPLQTYAAAGLSPPEGVSAQAPANMVGCGMSLPAQFHTLTLAPHERLLLCSDGFHQAFSGQALSQVLHDSPWPLAADTAERWCQQAQQAGAQDDVTVIVVEPAVQGARCWPRWRWPVFGWVLLCAVVSVWMWL